MYKQPNSNGAEASKQRDTRNTDKAATQRLYHRAAPTMTATASINDGDARVILENVWVPNAMPERKKPAALSDPASMVAHATQPMRNVRPHRFNSGSYPCFFFRFFFFLRSDRVPEVGAVAALISTWCCSCASRLLLRLLDWKPRWDIPPYSQSVVHGLSTVQRYRPLHTEGATMAAAGVWRNTTVSEFPIVHPRWTTRSPVAPSCTEVTLAGSRDQTSEIPS